MKKIRKLERKAKFKAHEQTFSTGIFTSSGSLLNDEGESNEVDVNPKSRYLPQVIENVCYAI